MPDYFSHLIAAEKIYDNLDGDSKKKIKSKNLYLIGAQGADLLFAYRATPSKANLGRSLHRRDALDLFKKLSEGNLSYAAGFATHYALDCTLHPAVYKYENDVKKLLAHIKFEGDLGLFISRYYHMRRTILPRETLLSCTFPLYDSVKLIRPDVTVTGVERCLKRHFSYTRYLYRVKAQSYRCDYDFNLLAPAVDSALKLGEACVKCVLSGDIDGAIFSKDFLQK